MGITRINEFRAQEEEGDALQQAIESYLPVIRESVGCLSCRLLRGDDDPTRIVVIEEWESVPDHRAAVEAIPADALERAKALSATPPRGGYFRG